MNTLEEIGRNLQIARIAKGLTSEQLAEKTGINFKTQARYEMSGKIPIEKLMITCQRLGVSIDDVCNKNAKMIIEFI